MKIGFIGAGNMASAIIKGAVQSGAFAAEDILAYDLDNAKTAALASALHISAAKSMEDLIAAADTVVLAVKPNVFASLLPPLSDALAQKDPLIVSIAAGKTLEFIDGLLKYDAAIIRVMPNINATVGEAMSAYCFNNRVTEEQKALAEKLCGSFGKVMCLSESYFPLFGVIAGCSPAFCYMFIDALARAGVKNGMAKADALKIAAQAVYGSAKQILEGDAHPWELIDRVCSPGGTTIEGVASLQADGLDAAVTRAVDAALDKDKKV